MPQIERLMEFPQDYFGSAADRSQLAARRLGLRDARKEVRPPQASVLPYHPYAHEPWRSSSSSRLHATNHHHHQQQQQQQQQQQTGNVGASPAQTYRRILLLGPSPPSNASDRLVSSLQNRNNNYYASSQYLPSRGGGCEINDRVGREAPPQSFRREVVRRDDDREKVTVNFLAAMANRKELMLPRAKDTDESDKSKQYAGLDVSLHL